MKNYFKITVKYTMPNEQGKIVKISEQYVVNAESFTESEAIITKYMVENVTSDFSIHAIQRKNYAEIITSNKSLVKEQSHWYECKLKFTSFDENSGKEMKTSSLMLAWDSDINSANDTVIELMKGTISDFEIEKIIDTKIIDVI